MISIKCEQLSIYVQQVWVEFMVVVLESFAKFVVHNIMI